MEYRVNAAQLKQTLEVWDRVLTGKEKIYLIACGGTALSLLGYKDSTKDVDFTVPHEADYERLRKFLLQAGYQPVTKFGWRRPDELTIYDLYPGQQVYETHLIASLHIETAKYALNEERGMTNFRIFMHRVDADRRQT